MKSIFVASIAALVLCVGCSPKLTENDVSTVLADNVPEALKSVVAVGPTETEMSSNGDTTGVKFKSLLKLNQPLYERVDFEQMAKSTGSDIDLFNKIEEAANGLNSANLKELAPEIEAAVKKPFFILQTAASGTATDWYGSFTGKKVVDRWVSSDFKTEVEPKLRGQVRTAFDQAAIDGINAKAWFTDSRTRQIDVLQKIETAIKLAQKDSEIEQAKAVATSERKAKEDLIEAQVMKARTMPIELTVRPALLGNTSVLILQTTRAMTVHLDVERGIHRFVKDLQLNPGRPTEIGHLEGWGFKAGDKISLSNSSFDTKIATVQ